MDEAPRIDSPSIRQHKRQLAWQIIVPVSVAAAIIIAAAVFVTTRGSAVDRPAADISLMWLIMPFLILALILLTLVVGLIYGAYKLHQVTPKYTGKVQVVLYKVQSGARKVSDGAASPFIWIDQAGAVLKHIFKR
jgi:hypothetical protein